MSSGWQHFELTGVLGSEMTGWECVGCGAHLKAEDRDGRTYGRVEHTTGCTELDIMLGQPAPGDNRSGMARIRELEQRADQADAALGTADNVLKGLGIQVEGLRTELHQLVTASAETAAMLASRDDGLDDRLAVTEQHLTPLINDVANLAHLPADNRRLMEAVSNLARHGEPGHAMPQARYTDWVLRITADGAWTEADLRSAVASGDTTGLVVHQVSPAGTSG